MRFQLFITALGISMLLADAQVPGQMRPDTTVAKDGILVTDQVKEMGKMQPGVASRAKEVIPPSSPKEVLGPTPGGLRKDTTQGVPAKDVTTKDAAPVVLPPPLPPGQWPAPDSPPPFQPEWKNLVDWSKVPNAPQSQRGAFPKCVAGKDEFCSWTCTGCTRNDTDVLVCQDKGVWGLTYDDGPTDNSAQLFDYLDSISQKATLFVIGSRALDHPDLLKRAYRSGHHIASHTWSHRPLTSLSNEEIVAEMKWTELIIKERLGITIKYARPPYGDIDDRVRAILKQLGYKIVIWNRDSNDWMAGEMKSFNPQWIDENFTKWESEAPNLNTGVISLQHDLYPVAVSAAIRVLPGLRKVFKVVPVASCLNDSHPYVEDVPYPTLTQILTTNTSATSTTTSPVNPATVPPMIAPEMNTAPPQILLASWWIGVVGVLMVLFASFHSSHPRLAWGGQHFFIRFFI
ncbi:uncharacterized protein VTP21DRAFT_6937 [Calcarisporiella thermophila]|uniref:uncharacterized protein n=1 Tax=Calcarisporiella thermophila TaxID=911321 RepID=UPI003743B23F